MRCERCDRPVIIAHQDHWLTCKAPVDKCSECREIANDLRHCISPRSCTGAAIDWRARALAAQAECKRLRTVNGDIITALAIAVGEGDDLPTVVRQRMQAIRGDERAKVAAEREAAAQAAVRKWADKMQGPEWDDAPTPPWSPHHGIASIRGNKAGFLQFDLTCSADSVEDLRRYAIESFDRAAALRATKKEG